MNKPPTDPATDSAAEDSATEDSAIEDSAAEPPAAQDSGSKAAAPVTDFLDAWSRGEQGAVNELFPLVTSELHRIAQAFMREERVNHTLQPTALINECYLRLADRKQVNWRNRAHFFAFAAKSMRRILVDHARARLTEKRGAGVTPVTLEAHLVSAAPRQIDLLAMDDALERLDALDPRLARLVELRVFAGLDVQEIADTLEISKATVHRDWSRARAWLSRELRG